MGECARRAVAPTTRRAVTREPEMVKAYRDTWTPRVYSYLAYAFEYSGVAFGNAGASAPSAADAATPQARRRHGFEKRTSGSTHASL